MRCCHEIFPWRFQHNWYFPAKYAILVQLEFSHRKFSFQKSWANADYYYAAAVPALDPSKHSQWVCWFVACTSWHQSTQQNHPLATTGIHWGCCRYNLCGLVSCSHDETIPVSIAEVWGGWAPQCTGTITSLCPAPWQRGMLRFLLSALWAPISVFQMSPQRQLSYFWGCCEVTQAYKAFFLKGWCTMEINTSSYSRQELGLGNSRPVISSQAGDTA